MDCIFNADYNQIPPRSNPLLYIILVVIVFGQKLEHRVYTVNYFLDKIEGANCSLLL